MKLLLKGLVAIATTVLLAMPGIGGEEVGGENAGGTGVWILPSSSCIGAPSQSAGQTFAIPDLDQDVKLVVSTQCGQVVATAIEHAGGGLQVPLPVSGREVTIPGTAMAGFANLSVSAVDIVIADANHCGYRILLGINVANRTAVLTVR